MTPRKTKATPGGVAEQQSSDALLRYQRDLLRFAAQELLLKVVPGAQTIEAIPSDVRLDELQELARQDFPAGLSAEAIATMDEPEHVKKRVRFIVGAQLQTLDTAVADCLAGGTAWQENVLQLLTETHRLAGYIDGIHRTSVDRSAPAAKGRTNIGDRTNRRIADAAGPYRLQGMPREQAAPLIAEKVGKGASTVQKRLSKLFPGDSWKPGRIDDTA